MECSYNSKVCPNRRVNTQFTVLWRPRRRVISHENSYEDAECHLATDSPKYLALVVGSGCCRLNVSHACSFRERSGVSFETVVMVYSSRSRLHRSSRLWTCVVLLKKRIISLLKKCQFIFKRKIRTWTGIWTSDLQISSLALYYLIYPGSIEGTGLNLLLEIYTIM